MLGYSRAMHKHAALLTSLLCATSLITGSARAQTTVPAPKRANPPVQVALPNTDLRAAFEAAERGTLPPATLAAHANHPLAGWLEFAALRRDLATLPLTQGDIATCLGVTSVYLNRLVGQLNRQGLIEFRHRHVRIPDRDALERAIDGPSRPDEPGDPGRLDMDANGT